ncbi:MAG TPA: futalosine hydrolase [Pilimelia sp.]|nr:futalosine hydrolase [Pilimelia sp.]
MSILVVTAVVEEADAVRAGLPATAAADVRPVGIGPAAAAAGTARLLALAECAGRPYRAVVNAGIGGGVVGRAPIGTVVVGTRATAAGLGTETPAGFQPLEALGFGATARYDADPDLHAALRRALPGARSGEILTVTTVTGTAASTAALLAAYPAVVAEAMEGFGAATAAQEAGVPFVEVRTVSNDIGPLDRTAWDLPAAFAALRTVGAALGHR